MNFFDRMKVAILHPSQYATLLNGRATVAIGYLLLIIFMVTLPIHINMALQMAGMFSDFVSPENKHLGDFVLADGKLTVAGPQPVVTEFNPLDLTGKSSVSAADSQNNLKVVVDTTGQTDESALEGSEQGFFIGSNRIVQRYFGTERTIYYSDMGDITLTRSELDQLWPYVIFYCVVFVLFSSIFVFVVKLLEVMILGLAVKWMSTTVIGKMSYADGLSLAIYSVSLSVILEGLTRGFWPGAPSWIMIMYYLLAIAYMIAGVNSYMRSRS